jgi:hypothetical protein
VTFRCGTGLFSKVNADMFFRGKGNTHGLGASGTDLRGLGGVKGDSPLSMKVGVRLVATRSNTR